MEPLPVLTSIASYDEFQSILQRNPGVIIIKMGATWCEPCKVIEPLVKQWFSKMPGNVQCYSLDVDDNFQIFGQFKKKKLVKGVPALFAYYIENEDCLPDDFVSGSDHTQVNMFFERCADYSSKLLTK